MHVVPKYIDNKHPKIDFRPKNQTCIKIQKYESSRYSNFKTGSPIMEFNSKFPSGVIKIKEKRNEILNEVIQNSEIKFKNKKATRGESQRNLAPMR